MRLISHDQADRAYTVLVEECSASSRDDDRYCFVQAVTERGRHYCREFRFCGALGFGGKFRNNGNNDNTPYVDCYQEHETPERLAMIEKANQRLAEIFSLETKQDD